MTRTIGSVLVLLPIACAGKASEPAKPAPSPTVSAPEPEPVASESPTPAASDTPSPTTKDACTRACDRVLECTKVEEAAKSCADDCKKELAPHPKAAEEYARCVEDFGCNAIAKSLQQNMGALGVCFTSAQKKMIEEGM